MNQPVETIEQIGGGLLPEDLQYTLALTNHKAEGGRKRKSKIQEGKGLKRVKKRVSKPKGTIKKTSHKSAAKKRYKKTTLKKACKPKKKVSRKTRRKSKKTCK